MIISNMNDSIQKEITSHRLRAKLENGMEFILMEKDGKLEVTFARVSSDAGGDIAGQLVAYPRNSGSILLKNETF